MDLLLQRVQSFLQAIKQRLRQWTKPHNRALAWDVVLDLTRSKSELMIEKALLRRQLAVLNRQFERPQLTGIRSNTAAFYFPDGLARRLVRFINPGRMPVERSIHHRLPSEQAAGMEGRCMIVQPETLLRWHRDVFRFVWRHKSKAESKPGRPPLSDDDIARIKRLARENPTWGAERIRGELMHLGIDVSKSTIQKVIEDERQSQTPNQTWATFIRNHASEIWACDFVQTYDFIFRAIFVNAVGA